MRETIRLRISKQFNFIKKIVNPLPVCDAVCLQYTISFLWFAFFILPFHQYYYYRLHFTQWDLLLFTGILAFIIGLSQIRDLRRRFEITLRRLVHRKVIHIDQDNIPSFFSRIEENAKSWAKICGIISAAAMFAAFAVVLLNDFFWQRLLLGIFETICAYIAGTFIGRMISYGQIGRFLMKEEAKIELQPTHVDGVAGLKPIGDFIFHQAMIASIPALYLASWWFLFPIWPRDYSRWEDVYLGLLSLGILFEILAFILPIWLFHKIMVQQKEHWLRKADTLSNTISEFRNQTAGETQQSSKAYSVEAIEEMKQQYWAIENMVTWPVDLSTRKKFRLNNLLLFIPLVGDIAKRNFDWGHLRPLLEKFLS